MRALVVFMLLLLATVPARGVPPPTLEEALLKLSTADVECVPTNEAADADLHFPFSRAIDAGEAARLRKALDANSRDGEKWKRLFAIGGVSAAQFVVALEQLCRAETGPVEKMPLTAYCTDPGQLARYLHRVRGNGPLSAQLTLALSIQTIPDDVASLILTRADQLSEARVADAMRARISKNPRASVRHHVLEGLTLGRADAVTLKAALLQRRHLARNSRDALLALVRGGGPAAGVAAVLLDDPAVLTAVLEGSDDRAQQALFVSARAIRAALPLDHVERLAGIPAVRPAVLAWLLVKDDAPERRLLARLAPDEIVGSPLAAHRARKGRWQSRGFVEPGGWEKSLVSEMHRPDAPDEIIALYQLKDFHPVVRRSVRTVVRVRGDQATVTVSEYEGFDRQRPLTPSELAALRQLMATSHADDLPSFDYGIGAFSETLHFVGGRAVRTTVDMDTSMLEDVARRGVWPALAPYAWMETIANLGTSASGIVYRVPGVELLWALGEVEAVWASGSDVRLFDGEWLRLRPDGRWEAASRPPACVMPFVRSGGPWDSPPWLLESHTGAFKVTDAGIFLRGRRIGGKVNAPAVSPDGRWLLGGRLEREDDLCVLVDVLSRRERRIPLEGALWIEPLGWNAERGRFVLYWHGYTPSDLGPVEPLQQHYVEIDPVTMRVTPYPGDGRPWMDHARHPFQSAGPHRVWVALPDTGRNETRVGILDLRTLSVEPVATYPAIAFDQRNTWFDAPAGFLYVVHAEHVLRLPLVATGRQASRD